MANKKISEFTALTSIADGDLLPIVDVSDTTDSADGTTKKITKANLTSGLITSSSTDTLTNKSISLGSNTVTGTTAQFNTALSDGDFATLAGSESLTNKTITAPVLSGSVTGTYTLAGTPTITSPTINGTPVISTDINFGANTAYFTETDNGNSGAADTIDWGTSNKQKSTLTGNCTFTFTAPPGPCNLVLKLVQDGTGSRTVTWPASVKWPAGAAPTLTTTASRADVITFYYDGTVYYGASSLNYVTS